MKKTIIFIALVISLLLIFTACGSKEEEEPITEAPTIEQEITEQEAETTEKETETTAQTTETATAVVSDPTTTTTVAETSTTTESAKEPVKMNVTCSSKTSEGKLLTKCAAAPAGGQNVVPGITWDKVEGAAAYAVYMIDESASNWLHMKAITTDTSIAEGAAINGQYVGPYPPSGNHAYVIYVIALKDAPSALSGNFDSVNSGIATLTQGLNVLGQGSTTVMYANGDNNV